MIFSVIVLVLIAYMLTSLTSNFSHGLRIYILLFLLSQPYMHISPGNLSVQSITLQLTALFLAANYFVNANSVRAQVGNFTHNSAVLWLCVPLFLSVFMNDIGENLSGYFDFLLRRVLYLYIGWIAVDSLRNGNKFIKSIMILFMVLCCYGVIEVLMQKNVLLDSFRELTLERKIMSYATEDRGYRVQSIYYHPYPWGGVLLLVATIFLYLILNDWKSKYAKYYLIGLGLICFNVFFTKSRSAIIPLTMMLSFAMLINSGKFTIRIKLIAAFIASAFLIIVLNPALIDKIAPYFSSSNGQGGLRGSSADMRLLQLTSTLDAIQGNVIGGKGFGASGKILSEVGGDTSLQAFESVWLAVLYNNGLLGVLGYAMFFLQVGINFFRVKRQMPPLKKPVNLLLLTIACYVLFISLTGEMHTLPFFFLFIGILSKYFYLQKKDWEKKKWEIGRMKLAKIRGAGDIEIKTPLRSL